MAIWKRPTSDQQSHYNWNIALTVSSHFDLLTLKKKMHKAAIFFNGLQLEIGAQKLKTSSYWFLFSIYRPTLSTPFAHCSISSLQAARYIKERKYFTTETSLFRPLLLQPFLPCVHSQKVFTVVLMRICNFHRKKGLCSWCIRPLYIFLTVLATTGTPAGIYLSHFVAEPQKPCFFDCFHHCLLDFLPIQDEWSAFCFSQTHRAPSDQPQVSSSHKNLVAGQLLFPHFSGR